MAVKTERERERECQQTGLVTRFYQTAQRLPFTGWIGAVERLFERNLVSILLRELFVTISVRVNELAQRGERFAALDSKSVLLRSDLHVHDFVTSPSDHTPPQIDSNSRAKFSALFLPTSSSSSSSSSYLFHGYQKGPNPLNWLLIKQQNNRKKSVKTKSKKKNEKYNQYN